MRWSAKIGRFIGVEVRVHASFALLVLWIGYVSWTGTGTVAALARDLVTLALLFACVLLHEYGHALAARRYGIGTRHITLLPIGGVALLDAMPTRPRHEIAIALAGPAVNFVIAAALWLVLAFRGHEGGIALGRGAAIETLFVANAVIAGFNLLPAFPMDGGRVLRALLSLRLARPTATLIAARLGQTLALGFGALGLLGNPVLAVIGLFIWLAARAELRATTRHRRLDRLTAGAAMAVAGPTLAPDDTLAQAAAGFEAPAQRVVLDGPRIVGVLSRAALTRGLRGLGPEARVADAMHSAAIADVATPLGELVATTREPGGRIVCVTRDGRLAGLLDLDAVLPVRSASR